jgi:hypothetical protein
MVAPEVVVTISVNVQHAAIWARTLCMRMFKAM